MDCPRCHAINPDGKNYCADCGAPLSSAPSASAAQLRAEIRAEFAEHFKDQKVFEIETTQAIVSRISEWAKLLGFFAATRLLRTC